MNDQNADTRSGPAPRLRLAGLAVGLLVAVTGTSAAEARTPDVEVSATPRTVELTGMPCQVATVQLGLTNTTGSSRFADLVIDGDAPLVLSRSLFSTWLPAIDPDQEVTAPLNLQVPRGTEPGRHDVELILDNAVRGSIEVEVVEPAPKGDDDNILAFEQVTASSTHGTHVPCALVDGVDDSTKWPEGGWNDGTSKVWPDTAAVTIPGPRSVGRVVLSTLDSATYPAERYGLSDWDVQLRVEGEWVTVDEVRGNTAGVVTSTFTPQEADGVRIVALASNNGDYARILELEAYAH